METISQAITDYLEPLVDTVREPLVVLDADLCVVLASRAFAEAVGADAAELVGACFWQLDSGRWDTPGFRQLLGSDLRSSSPVRGRRIGSRPGAGALVVNARRVPPFDAVLLAIQIESERQLGDEEDASEKQRLTEELERRVRERTEELEDQKRAALKLAEDAERAKVAAEEASKALRRSEAQLRQSQKMEAVGRLAGGVAHDFNNLLTAISSFSSFVMEGMRPEDPAYADMVQVQRAADRAASLTNQLLMFSRQGTVEPQVIDPNEKIAILQQMLGRLLGADIKVVTHLGTTVGCVCIDPTALEQVIVNLAVNARDAMPQGGQLLIETRVAVVDEGYAAAAKKTYVPPGEYVTVSVTDTGVGMDAAMQQHIFEPFFTTKEVGKGTGLGLSTVYGVVKQAGGYISVHSEVGKGTTFRVYLARHDVAATESRDVESTVIHRGPESVLLVEDDPQIQVLCERVLSRAGYRVTVVTSGGEALRLCEEEGRAFDLLLTDVVMPGMSGTLLASRLRPTRPEMKVLFMSGYTANAMGQPGVPDSAAMLLQKPFTLEGLTRKVRVALDGGVKT